MVRSTSVARTRTTFASAGRDLFVALAPARASKRLRLAAGLRDAIRQGRLAPHTRLPASRNLASDLGVSRGVVVDAYDQLIAEGYLVAHRGSGTLVAPHAGQAASATPPVSNGTVFDYDFRPGLPDLASFPRTAWLAALRRVLRQVPDAELGYGPPAGAPALRDALRTYLGRVRGVVTDVDGVVVTTGAAQGMSLLLRVARERGHRAVAVEDPGSPEIRGLVHAAGLEPRPVRVDDDGMRVTDLIATDARMVLVTPAHQLPLGVVLSAGRRHELLAWAAARDGVIVEDDYDAEYRYDRQPVGTVQGLAPEHVAYIGTASKTLAPALRLGWLVLPSNLRVEVTELKRTADLHSAVFEQLALADLLGSGVFDRHIRRTRQLYRRRRDQLVAALAPHAQVGGIAAGQHAVLHLPPGCDEAGLIEAGARDSVGLHGLGRYRLSGGPPGLVIGYARCSEFRFRRGLDLLTQLLANCS